MPGTRSRVPPLRMLSTGTSMTPRDGSVRKYRPDAVVGAWNAGILAYFSGHTVVNLDGVINDDVIPYLERADLSDYLDIRGITLLVDTDSQVPAFMNPFSGRSNWQENYELIHREGRVVVLQRKH